MFAERMPPSEWSPLARPVVGLTRVVIRFPELTLLVAGAVAVLSVMVAVRGLEFHTKRSDLLSPKSDYHRRWIAYTKEFGDKEDVVVVVQGEHPTAVAAATDDVATALATKPELFHAVLQKVDTSSLRSKGLYYLGYEQLAALGGLVGQMESVLQGNSLGLDAAAPIAAEMGMASGGADRVPPVISAAEQQLHLAMLARWLDSLLVALRDPSQYHSPWPEMNALAAAAPTAGSSQRLQADNGKIGLIMLQLAPDTKKSFVPNTEAIKSLRRMLDQVRQRHPNTYIGLTGLPIIEFDEMQASQSSSTLATILSLMGVVVVFIAGFGGLRHPMLAVLSLIVGLVWSLGFITLSVGHLNILSSAFGAMLIGLGIDYGVYYVARYIQLRNASYGMQDALMETARSIGPGIATGAITTAGAFFVAGFTDFRGLAELGVVVGGGALLCWLSGVAVLPAMICLSDRNRPSSSLPAPLDFASWFRPLWRRPRLTLALACGATAIISMGISRLWYDYSLTNLQPAGLESVEVQRTLLARLGRSALCGLSIANTRQEVQLRKQRCLELPSVERVEEIATLLPEVDARNTAMVGRIHAQLSALGTRPPALRVPQRQQLQEQVAQVEAIFDHIPEAAACCWQVHQIRGLLERLSDQECTARLSAYGQSLCRDTWQRAAALRAVSNPQPPQWSDLPEGLVSRFVGHNGKYLLKIYCKGDVWDPAAMEKFVADVRCVDPNVTGNPVQICEASRQMRRSYEESAVYAVVIVLVLVLIDLGSLWDALLAMLPLGLGAIQMIGLMGLLDIPFNSANMIVLPLINGIGVDYGIHVVHDFRRRKHSYRTISASTVTALVINSLTTMVGFGSLMIASHQGLQSLGRVLTIGLTCCLVSTLIVPCFFILWSRRHQDDDFDAGYPHPSQPSEQEDAAGPHWSVPIGRPA